MQIIANLLSSNLSTCTSYFRFLILVHLTSFCISYVSRIVLWVLSLNVGTVWMQPCNFISTIIFQTFLMIHPLLCGELSFQLFTLFALFSLFRLLFLWCMLGWEYHNFVLILTSLIYLFCLMVFCMLPAILPAFNYWVKTSRERSLTLVNHIICSTDASSISSLHRCGISGITIDYVLVIAIHVWFVKLSQIFFVIGY